MMVTAIQAFDATIVNVALPQLQGSFGGGIVLGSWVMTSYICAAAIMAPLTGYLRRRFGARDLCAGAIGLFVLASLLCSAADSLPSLILYRVVQGAAGGIIQPLAQAVLLELYPERDHGRMLAIWGATIMAGPVFGPMLGGVITDLASWRWIFVVNLPVGMLGIIGLRDLSPAREPGLRKFDLSGTALLALGVGALQLCLQRSIGRDWFHSPEILAEGSVAIAAILALVVQTPRSGSPILRFEVFDNINFVAAVFYNFMLGALLFTAIVFFPALGESGLGYSATLTGVAISPRGAATFVTMIVVGRLIDTTDHRLLLVTGWTITAASFAAAAAVRPDIGPGWLAGANAVQGIGVGLIFTPLSTLAFSTLAPALRTDASGLYSLLRQIGCATGVTVMTAVLQARLSAAGIVGPAAGNAGLFDAYAGCFRLMALVTLVIIPGTLLFRRKPAVPAPSQSC